MVRKSLVGQTVGHYIIEELIATGGMSQVYRARDPELDRTVAIKIIGIDTVREPVFAERLNREARTIAQLRHPNIVGIYHKGAHDDLAYLVIEYVNGPTLSAILKAVHDRGAQLDYRAMLTIVGSVCSALDYAHSLGVIHRDIKPSNIMADRNGMVYLTDFGLALRMVDGTEGKAFGSPYYIAPEQINSSADASPRSDIYALGVVTFRMLTGTLPFMAKKPMQVVMKHLSEPPPPPSTLNPALSPAVDKVIVRALAKNPQDRYWHASDFHKALANALGLPDMSGPTYQPTFLATTWTTIGDNEADDSGTFASATHLLEDMSPPSRPITQPTPSPTEPTTSPAEMNDLTDATPFMRPKPAADDEASSP
ncbi:MAG: serine/threonine-protein kinase [Anaerolineales bacterium]